MKKSNNLLTPAEIKRMKAALEAKKYSLAELFTSKGYCNYFTRTAKFITGKNIKVEFDVKSDTAYTNGTRIVINPILFDKSFAELSVINLGFLAHEIYHIIFTDFSILKKISRFKGNVSLLKIINNIVEDSAIEYFGSLIYVGDFKSAVIFLNETIFQESPKVEDIKGRVNQVLSLMCSYGSCGVVKGDLSKSLVKDEWVKIRELMSLARKDIDCEKRYAYSLEIYEIVNKLCKDDKVAAEDLPMSKKGDNSQSNPSQEILSREELEELMGSLDTSGDIHEDTKDVESIKEYLPQEDEEGMPESTESSSSGDDESKQSDESPEESTPDEKVNTEEGIDDAKKDFPQDSKDEEVQSIEDKFDSMLDDYSSLEESVTKDFIDEKLDECIEESKAKKLKDLSDKISYGTRHSKITNNITFGKISEEDVNIYNSIVSKNQDVINLTTRKLKKILKESLPETYRKQAKGIISQKDLVSDRLFTDGRIFKREKEGKDINVAFTIAVDESGSMRGKRISAARETAIIFKEICDNLNIPVCIAGFTAKFNSKVACHHYYSDFDSPSKFKYALAQISAKQDNRDGYSIRFFGETMAMRRPESKNILIVISDGLPLHNFDDYVIAPKKADKCLILKDTKEQIKHVEKKCKTPVIALNISGERYHSLMYNKVLDIDNLNELSTKLNNLLKKEFRK